MTSELKHIDPDTSTIILCVLFGFVFTIFIFIMCKSQIKKRRRNVDVLFPQTPVVVTSTTHTIPGGYNATQIPATTTTYHTQTYATPYPAQVPPHMPMPMPMPASQPPAPGIQPNIAPYPTMAGVSMNPPPYDVAVSGAGAGQPNSSMYEKQAPYNPNFQM